MGTAGDTLPGIHAPARSRPASSSWRRGGMEVDSGKGPAWRRSGGCCCRHAGSAMCGLCLPPAAVDRRRVRRCRYERRGNRQCRRSWRRSLRRWRRGPFRGAPIHPEDAGLDRPKPNRGRTANVTPEATLRQEGDGIAEGWNRNGACFVLPVEAVSAIRLPEGPGARRR